LTFIERALVSEPAVQAVVGIGSIASVLSRPGSDIDAILFFDPLDLYIVPAEFYWRPVDGSFHSIFSKEPGVEEESFQFDFLRVDLQHWADPNFRWKEGYRAELAGGWLAFDRSGQVASLIDSRTHYNDATRQARLDEAIITIDGHLAWDSPKDNWDSLGPAIAHDRLEAAYSYLVQGLFAYNRRWQIWRNREMSYLPRLPWLPERFDERILVAANAPSLDFEGYQARFEMLLAMFEELKAKLVADGDYEAEIIDQAFIRSHDEPGRAWNMAAWNEAHRQRHVDS
jgi:hypothetical protein